MVILLSLGSPLRQVIRICPQLNIFHRLVSSTLKMAKIRTVENLHYAKEMSEGHGAKVRRTIGSGELQELDPFLLLDHFNVKPPAGFPDHPHRGFETVTYMTEGSFTHEDFAGHKGVINEGDLQWMTAGRGIVHGEIPGPNGGVGLQLWVNLAAEDKMVPPTYQELRKEDIPVAKENGVTATVIAGDCLGVQSPIRTRTPTTFLDITLAPGANLVQPIDESWNAFSYVLHGKVAFGPAEKQQETGTNYCVVYVNDGNALRAQNNSDQEARFVIIAGKPLNQPVARRGPFVMNTEHELDEAFKDFHSGANGFENAKNWRSEYLRKQHG